MNECEDNKMKGFTGIFSAHPDVRRAGVLVCLGLVAVLALPVLAGATDIMDLSWNTVDGGGYTYSTGGTFGLGGTIGQPDAGNSMTGGTFGLQGGFWGGSA